MQLSTSAGADIVGQGVHRCSVKETELHVGGEVHLAGPAAVACLRDVNGCGGGTVGGGSCLEQLLRRQTGNNHGLIVRGSYVLS